MNRRAFLKWLGSASAVVLVAPSMVITPTVEPIEWRMPHTDFFARKFYELMRDTKRRMNRDLMLNGR